MVLEVLTESGTTYEVDNDALLVRRLGGNSMRRDGEWLRLLSPARPKKGACMVMEIEPLAADTSFTKRTTNVVVSVKERTLQ